MSKSPDAARQLAIIATRPGVDIGAADSAMDAIIAMLRLVPGSNLQLRVGSEGFNDAGAPPSLVVRLGASTPELGDGIGHVLADIVAVTQSSEAPATSGTGGHVWIARPDSSNIGFTTRGGRAAVWSAQATPNASARSRLWRALGRWHGGHLEVSVAVVDGTAFQVTAALVGRKVPPLELRAALADAWPGLTFSSASLDAGGPIKCDEAEARLVVLLPVDGDGSPGFRAAPPAPLPVTLAGPRPTATGIGVTLGAIVTDAGIGVDAVLGDEELLRHVHVVGATGTGKSTLLAAMVHQLAHSAHGALVLDPHGTLVDRILDELPAAASNRCMVVRADDLDNPTPLNPLAAQGESGIGTAIADIGEMFYELFDQKHTGIVGPRFEERIANALRGLVTLRGPRASLLDVPLMLGHAGMRKALDAALTDPKEKLWWRNEDRNAKSSEYGDLVAWCNSKFERFSGSPALRAILGSGYDAYDPARAMDEGRIILVDLAKGQIGQSASRLLGYLLLNRFWTAAMNRDDTRRFHVIVDEAHSVMAGSLVNMLSEGRKFGISVTAAHQYLGQLDAQVGEALVGNVGTSVIFRANGPHVGEIVAASGGQLSAATLANLPTFTSVVIRNAAVGVGPRPHTLIVNPESRSCARADKGSVAGKRWLQAVDLHALDADAEYPNNGPAERPEKRNVGGPGGGSFLDEWLAKRQKPSAENASETPAADRADPLDSPANESSEPCGVGSAL